MGSACRSRRSPSGSSGSRRRSRSACRCGATTTARTAGRHYQLEETLCSPDAGQHAAAAHHDRRERRAEDAPARRAVRRRLQHLRRRRRGRAQARRPAAPLRHVGRDPNEIEVTAMYRDLPPDATTDDLRPRRRSVRGHRCVDAGHRRGRRRPRRVARVHVRTRDRAASTPSNPLASSASGATPCRSRRRDRGTRPGPAGRRGP